MDVESLIAKDRSNSYSTKLPSKEIANQVLSNFQSLFTAPEINFPKKDYSLKANLEEDQENPNIGMFIKQLSTKAQEEWIIWLESLGIENIEQLFLTPEELEIYNEYKIIIENFNEEEISFLRAVDNSICSSTLGFKDCKITDFTVATYNPSEQDRDQKSLIRELESKGRLKEDEQSFDFSFMDPLRDPDFFNPLNVSNKSRGGYLFKFASRPYNLSFTISFKLGETNKIIRINPTCAKDYSCVEDVKYYWDNTLKQKYPEATDVVITIVTNEDSILFETDLRFSPEDNPNPTNYMKVDVDSPIGRRLMRSLKENPYHEWEEISWKYSNETKVALYRKAPKGGVYWVYLDKTEIATSRSKNFRRVIYPQVTEKYDRNIHTGIQYIIMYNIRVSNYENLEEPFNYLVKVKLNTIVDRITNSGFVFVSKSQPDTFDTIVYSFLRNDLLTVKQRYLERTKDER